MTRTATFLLNGEERRVADIRATQTLLAYLRLQERLTGTKEGCAEGDCGACTVMVGTPRASAAEGFDWRAVNGCIFLLAEADGRAVVTVDALAERDALHPVQTAMIESHGSQCGFCTPGFVMSMAAHRAAGLPDTEAAVHETLSGNLCRCTGYRPIVDALRRSAAGAGSQRGLGADREASWAKRLAVLTAETEGDGARNTPPETLDALDALLARDPALRPVAGATDVGVGVAKDGADPGALVSVTRIPELRVLQADGDTITIGAAVTYADALPVLDAAAPAFAAMIRRIGSRQIRNMGTIGGNLCNASPIGDSAPALMALGASVTLRSARGRRTLALDDFFTGYRKTALEPGEYLERISFPRLSDERIHRVYKLSKRYDQDISTVSMAAAIDHSGGIVTAARLAFGGMAASPARAPTAEAALIGAPLTAASFEAAAAALAQDFSPLSDFRGSAAYRAAAAGGLIRRLGAEIAAAPGSSSEAGRVLEVWRL